MVRAPWLDLLSALWGGTAIYPAPPASRQRRRAQLEEAVALFSFYSSCGEHQAWLDKQVAMLSTLQLQAHNWEATQLKYKVHCGPMWGRQAGGD